MQWQLIRTSDDSQRTDYGGVCGVRAGALSGDACDVENGMVQQTYLSALASTASPAS